MALTGTCAQVKCWAVRPQRSAAWGAQAIFANRFALPSRYDLNLQPVRILQSPITTASAGGVVQHGLSAARGVFGFYEHCSAADKR